MSTKWHEVKQQISTFRKYVQSLSPAAKKEASYCYLITAEEIKKLLSQCGDGSDLHGLRFYIGAKMIDKSMVPVLHVVACQRDGNNNYNDYNVPDTISEESAKMPLLGSTQPCPTYCSQTNALNQ
jgi:hypothetical protein